MRGEVSPKVTAYLAGPMRGYPDQNRPLFHQVEALVPKVLGSNFTVWNPATHDLALGDNAPIESYLKIDMPEVSKADWILLLPGWRKSEGACKEVCVAAWTGSTIVEITDVFEEGFLYQVIPSEYFSELGRLVRGYLDTEVPTTVKAPEDSTGCEFSVEFKLPADSVQPNDSTLDERLTACVQENPEVLDKVSAAVNNEGLAEILCSQGCRSKHYLGPKSEECKDFPEGEEVLVTDPKSGGQKGYKSARFDLIPSRPHWLLARVYGFGAKKRADNNWAKGFAYGGSIGAMERHLQAFKGGYFINPESGLPHLMHAAWHCYTLVEFVLSGIGTDDRLFQFLEARKQNEEQKQSPAAGF